MLKSIKGINGWHHKDCRMIDRLRRWWIVKQDELDGDPKFIATIGLGGKSTNHWEIDKKKSWKWRGVCKAYKNPILESNVGHWKQRKGMRGTCCFDHKRWYNVKYGLGVFREGTIIDDNLHIEKCSWLLTRMNGCNIFFNRNLWIRIIEIKTE
jgi:hypothetical protein